MNSITTSSIQQQIKEEHESELQRHVMDRETVYRRKKLTPASRVHNKFKKLIAATDTNHIAPKVVFGAFVAGAPLTKFKPTEMMLRGAAKLGGTHNTKGVAIPVHVDLDVQDNMVHPPVELVKEAIRESEYRVIMNNCVCREMDQCKNYPLDIGCMFLGRTAEVCVEHKSGHEATVEECLNHVDRAIAAGLSIGAYWVEFEQYAWGFQDETFPDFIAFCFCCPCCCHAIKFENLAGGELRHIMYQSSGYRCEPIEYKCIGCGSCVKKCPRGFLKLGSRGVIEVNEHCAGCGLCLNACPQKALHVVKCGETKEHLQDYFDKLEANW